MSCKLVKGIAEFKDNNCTQNLEGFKKILPHVQNTAILLYFLHILQDNNFNSRICINRCANVARIQKQKNTNNKKMLTAHNLRNQRNTCLF